MENNSPAATPETFPMKWHNFLTRFSLWASMAFVLLDGVMVGMGTQYDPPAAVFARWPALKMVHAGYALASIAIAIYTFKVRKDLARFRWAGVKGLYVLYFLSPLVSIAFSFLQGVIIQIDTIYNMQDQLPMLAGAAIGVLLHRKYYHRRAALFTE